MPITKNITNNKYGRLTAIKLHHKKGYSHFWLFKCDCGQEKVIVKNSVTSGYVKSCGCLLKESSKKNHTIHGMSNTKFYGIWCSMKKRCANPNDLDYKNYGGRGIKCFWASFPKFKDEMYDLYLEHCLEFGIKNTSIDRVNNSGNYCFKNCKWATQKEQANNRRPKVSKHYK